MKGIGWYKKAIEKLDVSYNIGEINSEISNSLSEYFIDEKKLIHLLKQKDIIIHVAEKQNSVLLSIFKNAYTCILKAKVRDHIKRVQKNPDQITTRLRENYEIPEKFKKFFKIRKDYQSSFKKYLKENIKKKMLSYHKLMQQAEGAIFKQEKFADIVKTELSDIINKVEEDYKVREIPFLQRLITIGTAVAIGLTVYFGNIETNRGAYIGGSSAYAQTVNKKIPWAAREYQWDYVCTQRGDSNRPDGKGMVWNIELDKWKTIFNDKKILSIFKNPNKAYNIMQQLLDGNKYNDELYHVTVKKEYIGFWIITKEKFIKAPKKTTGEEGLYVYLVYQQISPADFNILKPFLK